MSKIVRGPHGSERAEWSNAATLRRRRVDLPIQNGLSVAELFVSFLCILEERAIIMGFIANRRAVPVASRGRHANCSDQGAVGRRQAANRFAV
ncbi:MAG: hypothetical protein O7F76_03080 [Planctomycetota bacterium]|nr:hypothetical protein [Planctomycetota bacterium]